MFTGKRQPSRSEILHQCLDAVREYHLLRDLYGDLLTDQLLQLSPNFETVLAEIAARGVVQRERYADLRMMLVDGVVVPREPLED